MKSTIFKSRPILSDLVIATVFVVSRYVYDRAGIRFEGDLTLGYWHYIDPALLRTDLWSSLLHLHSQPPVMNLFIGIVYRAFPYDFQQVMHVLYYGMGILLAFGIHRLCLRLNLGPRLSAVITLWFVISPGTVLYEHSLAYGYPITLLMVLSGFFLMEFTRTGWNQWGHLLFWSLAIIALLWGFFHILWLILAAVILLAFSTHRRQVILAGLIPILLVSAWYAKNLIQVGDFTGSTWLGMNLSKIVTFRTPEEERQRLVRNGDLSEFALIPPFRNPLVYLELLPHTPRTGVPLLDEIYTSLGTRNFHHLVYVEAAHHYLKDALHLMRLMPAYYVRSVGQALYIYFHSPSDFDPVLANRMQIEGFDRWWNRIFYGQWLADETSIERNTGKSIEHLGWWIVLGFTFSLTAVARFLWTKGGSLGDPQALLILFMTYNILYVTFIGNLLDIGENNRFRFTVDPFLMILFVFFAKSAVSRLAALDPAVQTSQRDSKQPLFGLSPDIRKAGFRHDHECHPGGADEIST